MDKKKFTFLVFCLVAVAQLFVPAKMIADKDNVLAVGKAFKFKAAPVDPSDPLRGKYIVLNFEANQVKVASGTDWDHDTPVYLLLSVDSNGYAKVDMADHEKPIEGSNRDYVLAKALYYNPADSILTVEYPFNRYYMEESKAQAAEDLYQNSLSDSTRTTYALVYIHKGEAVLKDVMVNEASIKDLVK